MTATEFIISSLKSLCNSVKGINIAYAYDNDSMFHVIEVSPETIRRGDEAYMKWEGDMWETFYQLFPEEDILISEPDSTNNMENILFKASSEHETESDKVHLSFNFKVEDGYSDGIVYDYNNENLLAAA